MPLNLPNYYLDDFKSQIDYFESMFLTFISKIYGKSYSQYHDMITEMFCFGRRTRPTLILSILDNLDLKVSTRIEEDICIIEYLHRVSIALDDLVDHDKKRRNLDTFWTKFGPEKTILFTSFALNKLYIFISDLDIERKSTYFTTIEKTISGALADKSTNSDYSSILYKTTSLFILSGKVIQNEYQINNHKVIEYFKTLGKAFQISNDITDLYLYLNGNPRDNEQSFYTQFKNNFFCHKYNLTKEYKARKTLNTIEKLNSTLENELKFCFDEIIEMPIYNKLSKFTENYFNLLYNIDYWNHDYV